MKTRILFSVLLALIVSVFSGGAVAFVTGLPTYETIGALFGLSQMPGMSQGLRAGVLVEVWTGELLKRFRHEHDFLSRIPKRNEFVNKNAIHMADLGADPDVLINNTAYPIASAQRTDEDIIIALDKFETTNTIITDDELYGLPYDKKGSVITQHNEVLEEKTAKKAAHSLAPSLDTAVTPLVLTTGVSDGGVNACKRLVPADIVRLKRKMDDLLIPKQNRILVLCNAHIEDLLLVDQVFEKQYKDIPEGKVLRMYGFDIYEHADNPVYYDNAGDLTKRAYGAAADPATDQNASLAFYTERAVQARGDANMYYADASTDPKYRQSEVGFRLYHICLPKKLDGFCALVSDIAA